MSEMEGSGDSSVAQVDADDIREHWRVRRLSERAREMYLDLRQYASPDGFVVAMRVYDWLPGHRIAFSELILSGLLVNEGVDQYRVTRPEQLDQAEMLAGGDVP